MRKTWLFPLLSKWRHPCTGWSNLPKFTQLEEVMPGTLLQQHSKDLGTKGLQVRILGFELFSQHWDFAAIGKVTLMSLLTLSIGHSFVHLSVPQHVSGTSSRAATEARKVKWDDPCPCGMPTTYQALGLAWRLKEMSHIQLLPFRGSLAIEADPQGSQPNQKRELQRAVGAQRSGRQEEMSPRREALVGLSGWLVALGLCCCTRAFSLLVARRGSSLAAAHRLLTAVASRCRVQALGCTCFSSCSTQPLRLRLSICATPAT